jgi:hypothetical protein
MNYKLVESREIVWCNHDDRYVLIVRENDEIIGLNWMQGDDLELFKEHYCGVDTDLTDFYNAIEPYLDERNDEIGKINAAIWSYHEYLVLKELRCSKQFKK